MSNDIKISQTPEAARVRLTLDLSQKLNAIVEKIAAENGTSKADVLRFAIEFLGAADNAKRDGMRVGAWEETSDGNRREREFVGL
jgi:hypothetical protein